MRLFNCFALSFLLMATFCGCTSRTEITTVRIADPEVGLSLDVPVQANGTFSQELKKDNVVAIASGKISYAADAPSVTLVYERRRYSTPEKFASEKLETTFTAQPDTDVPIGKNPAKTAAQPSTADQALTHVTVKLLKGP